MLSSRITSTKLSLNNFCAAFSRVCSLYTSPSRRQNVEDLATSMDTDVIPQTSISHPPLPIVTSRSIEFPNKYREPRVAWVESLGSIEDEKLGLIDLHPDVFATFPRLDIIHNNICWQKMYKYICYKTSLSRAEKRGGGRKPWPQKGTGRARHGSIRSPIFKKGGAAHGPRGPKSYFYMMPTMQRALGLRVALSVKLAQNDLHVVDSLEIPTDQPEYMESLVASRNWGYSVLFVDDTDIMPRNISLALDKIDCFNLMPTYGLNVYSMIKHDTLVITMATMEKLEEKLLYQMHKCEGEKKYHSTYSPNREVTEGLIAR